MHDPELPQVDLSDSAWLLLHGLGDLPERFEPLAELLRGAGGVTYAPNLSDEYEECVPQTFDTLAQRVFAEFNRRHSDRKSFVVGHSMGGQVAICVAQQQPLIAGLVLLEASLHTQDAEAVGRYLDEPGRRSGRERLIARLLEAAPDDPIAMLYVESLRTVDSVTFGKMAAETVARQREMAATYAALECNKLQISGELNHGRFWRESTNYICPGAGHWVHLDAPALCWALILQSHLF